jgi:5-methylcytosine-specific restriction endonuclease McrA
VNQSWAAISRLVEERAKGSCEYCRMKKVLQRAPFHYEHIIPRSKGGTDHIENLAWSCAACNLSKSNRTELIDPETNEEVPLFNPRSDRWDEHVSVVGYRLVGLTSKGRALIAGLDLNDLQRIYIRQVEQVLGLS